MRLQLASVAFLLFGASLSAPAGDGVWSGPLVNGGPVIDIEAHPADADIAYALTSGGLFITRDGAQAWQLVDGGFGRVNFPTPSLARRLALDPSDPRRALLADPQLGRLWISRDTGGTWQDITPGALPVSSVNSNQTQVVAASGFARILFAARDASLWSSEDTGASWRRLDVPWPTVAPDVVADVRARLLAVGIVDASGEEILASLVVSDSSNPPPTPPVDTPRLYRSVDGGASWNEVAGTPWPASMGPAKFLTRADVPGRVFAMARTATTGTINSDLYRSDDGGLTWGNPSLTASEPNFTDVELDPVAADQAWLVSSGAVRKPLDASSWTTLPRPTAHPASAPSATVSANALVFPAGASASTLWLATSIGVVTSTDAGATYTRANAGIEAEPRYRPLIDPGLPAERYLLGGASNNPVSFLLSSSDGGISVAEDPNVTFPSANANIANLVAIGWEGAGSPASAQLWVPTSPAGNARGLPVLSIDRGRSWNPVSSFPDLPNITNEAVTVVAAIPGSAPPGGGFPQTLLAGYSPVGVYRSSDGGSSWALSSTGLPAVDPDTVGTPAQPYRLGVGTLQVSPADPQVVWLTVTATAQAGANPAPTPQSIASGVYRSADGGATWQHRSAGLPATTGTNINQINTPATLVLDPTDSDRAFASVLVSLVSSARFRTLDGGISWERDTSSRPATAVAYDTRRPGVTYEPRAGRGVFRCTQEGTVCEPFNRGLEEFSSIGGLTYDAANDQVMAATGGGIYRLSIVPDADGDGVPDAEEAAGPAGGDANGDGQADSAQANVSTDVLSVTPTARLRGDDDRAARSKGAFADAFTVALLDPGPGAPAGCMQAKAVRSVASTRTSLNVEQGFPAPYVFPDGLISVQLANCDRAVVRLTFHGRSFLPGSNALRTFGSNAQSPLPQWRPLEAGAELTDGGKTWQFEVTDASSNDIAGEANEIWFQVAVGYPTGIFQGTFETP